MKLVKNKLRNSMEDDRFSNLCLLAYYLNLVDRIDILKIYNLFVERAAQTSYHKKLFGKFVVSDIKFLVMKLLDIFSITMISDDSEENIASLLVIENTILDSSANANVVAV